MPPHNPELQRYLETTPRSRALAQEATAYLPGGDSRTTTFWHPYPLYLAGGEGCRVRDVDGVERLDFVANFTTMILGHHNPLVTEAMHRQAETGVGLYGATELQTGLARALCQRVPSLELVRFTNSGTEATMNCIAAARAFTGRRVVAKCEGGYHGTHPTAMASVRPPLSAAGDPHRPVAIRESAGVTPGTLQEVVVIPYNDPEAARQVILEHREELAAVIVEPMLGTTGMVPGEPAFLEALREVTREHGILLIFDEVVTLRLAPGGAQSIYGVTPDLTAMGKFIGGGLPVGAFGGRRDVMSLYDPTRLDPAGRPAGPAVPHGGSFNGHPMVMAAGLATLEQLTPDVYRRLNAMGDRLREGARSVLAELEVPAQVTGLGSLFALHFTPGPVRCYRDIAGADMELRSRVFLGLLNEGVLMASQMVGCTTTPMGDAEVDAFLSGLRRVLGRLA